MNILDFALTYFDNGAVPTAKVFADDIWRPNYVNFNSDEKKAIDFMGDYARCYHRMGSAYMTGTIFSREYANVLKNTDVVNAMLSRPLDVELLKQMHKDGLVELKNRNDKRAAERKDLIESKVMAVKDNLISFDKRRAQITALMEALENDMQELNSSFGDENIKVSNNHALYGGSGGIVIIDTTSPNDWQELHYAFNSDSDSLTEIDNPLNVECDCCDCCNCD